MGHGAASGVPDATSLKISGAKLEVDFIKMVDVGLNKT
jgi:hypothetical protein